MPAIQFIQNVTGGIEPSGSIDARNVCPFARGRRGTLGCHRTGTASRRERTSVAISPMLMLCRHKLSLHGD